MSERSIFRVGAEGFDDAEVYQRCLNANAKRRARLVIEDGEDERIARLLPEIPTDVGVGNSRIVEALRRMKRFSRVDEPIPITSHRSILGPALVAAKRAMRRILRFETLEPWQRQAEFNVAVAALSRAVLMELGRIRAEKATMHEPAVGSDREAAGADKGAGQIPNANGLGQTSKDGGS